MMIEELYRKIEEGASLNELFLFLRDNKYKFTKEQEQLITECPKSAICLLNLMDKLLEDYMIQETDK